MSIFEKIIMEDILMTL